MSIRLYVEGGGDSKALKVKCRKGFKQFFEKAGLSGRLPRVVACGSRNDAFGSFKTAQAQTEADGHPMLLVDSEGRVEQAADPWRYLQDRDGWPRPDGSDETQCQLMVQVMESWFLADREALEGYFGNDFRSASLPGLADDVESIPKADVLTGLRKATRDTPKGKYSKGKHSFSVLECLDPAKVEESGSWARRLLQTLRDES